MARYLVCQPRNFGVHYDINPWMTPHLGRVEQSRARHQWLHLVRLLHAHGATLEFVDTQPAGLPDLVFTANAALVVDGVAVLARFAHAQRQAETPHYRAVLQRLGLRIDERFTQADLPFEGAGDALRTACGHLVVAWGFRSHRDAADLLARGHPALRGHSVQLVDPRFYHLDTCFCPLSDGTVLWYPPAFAQASQRSLRELLGDNLVELTDEEALAFGCNAVQVGQAVIAHHWSPRLAALLARRGYHPVSTPLTEFIKAGGSAKCLTLQLD
jgi:N-dimethylarginine dimethylaminohydrolase